MESAATVDVGCEDGEPEVEGADDEDGRSPWLLLVEASWST